MSTREIVRLILGLGVLLVLSGCTVPPPMPRSDSKGHLNPNTSIKTERAIPKPVQRRAFVPAPKPQPSKETFTVVVNEVPVRELLFALARDASMNVDIHPDIQGNVTLNAVDQTLNQILDRFARQLPIRYEQHGKTLAILPDKPFLRTYQVDYVNVTRDSAGKISASTLVADGGSTGGGGGGGGNTSKSDISSVSNNHFWDTLEASLEEITNPEDPEKVNANASLKRVISNRETGIVMVRATAAQHKQVRRYIDRVLASAKRQVLIEATIVEVTLNDRYQAGINWKLFTRQGGLTGAGITLGSDLATAFTAGASSAVTGLILNGSNAQTGSTKRNVELSISLLNEFGDTKVLSSPKLIALNNQPAALKVVDNEVYFEVKISTDSNQTTTTTTFDTDARTVSVGLVMGVTPQISDNGEVTLHVRPTITRVREFIDDPAIPVALAQAGITNLNVKNSIPVIQVRESETVMKVGTGQIAVLGGLMQDNVAKDDEAVPGVSEISGVGDLFKFKDRSQTKSELVIFLRPTVINSASVDSDLAGFAPYLPRNLPNFERQKVPFKAMEGVDQ